MSAGNPNLLSFVCPQCQKKLRAPIKLAGQKLSCPQCQAAIRVPGTAPQKNDDDDWLSLDDPPSVPPPTVETEVPSKVPASTPATSPAQAVKSPAPESPAPLNLDDDFALAPLSNNEQKAAPKSAPAKAPSNESSDDDFGLEALSPNGAKKETPSERPATTTSASQRSVFDDDLPDLIPLESSELPKPKPAPAAPMDLTGLPSFSLAPETPVPSAGVPTASSPKVNTSLPGSDDLYEIPLAPLEPMAAGANSSSKAPTAPRPASGTKAGSSPQAPKLVGSLEEIMRESDAMVSPKEAAKEKEFSFKCKVCGTLLYAERAKVGSKTRCPDCFSEFTVPTPPARKKEEAFQPAPSADVTFAPVDSKSVHNEVGEKAKSKEMLKKAAQAIRDEEEGNEHLTVAFDSKRWVSLVFWFLRDPLLDVVIVILGILCAIWLAAVTMLPVMAGLDGLQAALLQAVLFLVPFIPVFITLMILGTCVLSTTANQYPKIQDWPFNRLGDAMSELFTLVVAMGLAAIPGGLIGSISYAVTGTYLGTVFFTMLAIWALVPFMIYSMTDNNSMFEPYSKSVYQSLKVKTDAWGAMYFQTAIAFLCMFVAAGISLIPGPMGEILSGLMLPFFTFFVFNQWGLLAGRISDVTELGFTGDFSQDHAE